ncbi:Tim44 domain-containing protein [Marinobacterium aestuariivivens]|uniref:Tim44 domain-containing protein n=1 Tax=Marinobacterium aestuariivivens TaxID=1698799 RepID=A0ABW1ZWG6_9GAMM
MQKLITIMFAVFLGFSLLTPDAEAGKRFGGGSSIGKSFSAPKKTSPTSNETAGSTTTQQKAATSPTGATTAKKPGMMGGLLGGLLAGGLLGALFFGGAFDGIQFMDILLIGLLAFMAYKLFAMFRRQQSPAPAYAGVQQGSRAYEPAQSEPMARAQQPQPDFGAASGSFGTPLGTSLSTPSWFNQEAFVEGAKSHFIKLQKAWDESNWDEIRTYVSPELLSELQRERAKNGEQHTEVVSVMAELANFIDNGDHVVVSLNFYGWLKEDSDQTTEFNEVWHLTRDSSVPNADWIIVGIEQP